MAILSIPITKAGNRKLEVDTSESALPAEIFLQALEEGLKVILNKRMSKITTKGLEDEALVAAHDAAFAIAQENLEAAYAGKVSKGRAAATTAAGAKIPGVVMTEARRLAKEVVKNEIRAAGMKISHVEAKVITAAANELIASDPSYVETATANIEARTAKVTTLNIASLVHESPKLVAKAEEAKAEKKTQLSSKQAGIVMPRKPKANLPSAPESHPHHAN